MLRFLSICAGFLLGLASANAAEIRIDSSSTIFTGAVLEGKIEPGDFQKFRDFVLNNSVVQIYLASPGGNLGEAMKIGILIRLLKLSTVVPTKPLTNQSFHSIVAEHDIKDARSDYKCASACFFLFVAGIHRSSDDLEPAVLGIHRPFIEDNELKRLDRQQAISAEERTRTTVVRYLQAMDVPPKYAEDMYSVPKDMIQWIRQDEFESDFNGFIPGLRTFVDAKCGRPTDQDLESSESATEKAGHSMSEAQLKCQRRIQAQLALSAYTDVLQHRNSNIPLVMLNGKSAAPEPNGPKPLPPDASMTSRGSAYPSSVQGPAFPSSAPLPGSPGAH